MPIDRRFDAAVTWVPTQARKGAAEYPGWTVDTEQQVQISQL
jgi:hypothetical protein